MFSKLSSRVIIVVTAGLIAVAAGFLLSSRPVQQEIAAQTARGAFGQSKLNLLVLGYQEDEATTDTVILVHLDVDRRNATLVSIPRDTWVPIPAVGPSKINTAYAYGGPKATAKAVGALMGNIPIDATLALQPQGAAQIVDALGGLNVNVDENMDYDDYNGQLHIHLRKGEHYLTGSQVLGYIRFRHDPASDFGRVKRQQQVLKLMLDQVGQPQNWAKLPRILQFARKDMKTALTDRQLMALLEIYRNVPDENVRSFTLPSKAGWAGDASVVFADERWAKLIGKLLFSKVDPPQDNVVVANATGIADFDKTIVGALRGAGWNVPTFVDQPVKPTSIMIGTSPAAKALSKTLAVALRFGKDDTLVIGADLAPDIK